MKRLILPVLLLMLTMSWAQPNERAMQERIKAQKVAFITERLDLSPEEAQKFWPIYNAFEDEANSMRQNDLKEVRQAMRRGNLTESEAQRLLDQFMAVEDKLHNAKKKLVKDLGGAIPPQKIIQLKAAEDAFNKKILQMLQQRRENMQKRRNKNTP
ncbi:MAG: sensor of ECF-type sigma factor [Bacteroidia bacterium]|nr:sensor of ECF-type sigma factor [Bacteroidia bacterium]MBT8268303.1 sensor of ECF-type sigma factor [Bacteroidia bacterium]NNF81513.1 sensor of ECF-type sigma factor [Flavobacteriaceae bacterium]NNK70186.1 sensor of ECF-type sigma factor [Flavobacteriaceae bacterium]NNL81206.1 sensor of ECF-type sigma factor [Flavobacteriaceae bacterium]